MNIRQISYKYSSKVTYNYPETSGLLIKNPVNTCNTLITYFIFVGINIMIMLDAPLMEGGNLFIWIVCIAIAFVGALVAVDILPKNKKEDTNE